MLLSPSKRFNLNIFYKVLMRFPDLTRYPNIQSNLKLITIFVVIFAVSKLFVILRKRENFG